MRTTRPFIWVAALFALPSVIVPLHAIAAQKPDKEQEAKRPRLTLRAQPPVGIAPVRIVFTAEIVGGANDAEEYTCPGVVWDWGDDTRSEAESDCAPFEPGKSEIKRRYTVEHTFGRAGGYRVAIHLKHRDKEIAVASTPVQVQAGFP